MNTKCNFSFDNLDLFGIKNGRAFVKGWKHNVEDEECLLAIKKADFNKMIKMWLKEKEDFCKRYDHFCGVGGIVYCEGIHYYDTKIYDDSVDVDIDDPNWKEKMYKPVAVYKIVSFDPQIDMEHG